MPARFTRGETPALNMLRRRDKSSRKRRGKSLLELFGHGRVRPRIHAVTHATPEIFMSGTERPALLLSSQVLPIYCSLFYVTLLRLGARLLGNFIATLESVSL